MKVAISAIGKQENKYIREWVLYYQAMGVSKIFLYDNNDPWGEYFEQVIQDKIDEGFVEIIDYTGKTVCQCESYQETLDKHYKEYDWIAFIDCDEFITFIQNEGGINEYVSHKRFKNYDAIKINFLCYGDNGLIYNAGNSALQVFKNKIPLAEKGPARFPNVYHSKMLIRCSAYDGNNIKWNISIHNRKGDPHFPIYNTLKTCNNSGKPVLNMVPITVAKNGAIVFDYDCALIRHYSTKTITEFLYNKVTRGFPDQICNFDVGSFAYNLSCFYAFNGVDANKIKAAEYIFRDIFSTDKSVICEARGRIGNIMFNIATLMYYAKLTNKTPYLYIDYNLCQYAYNSKTAYIDWLLKQKPFNTIKINIIQELPDNIYGYMHCYEKHSTEYRVLPGKDVNANIFIHGFRQSAKYFDKKTCKQIYKCPKALQNKIYEKYPDIENYVAINVRRGDFLINTNVMYVSPAKWFKKIVSLYDKQQKFLIVSDDIEWCKQQFKGKRFIFKEDIDKYDKIISDLYIQTFCKDNIISNSTFSWWGAHLNIHDSRKVYYHSPWFVNNDNDYDIIPENDNWINI